MLKNNLFYIFLIISTFCAVLLFNPNLQWNSWDTYEYINLGKSLASGEGYRQIWHPNEPLGSRLPLGYPFLLSLLMKISANIIFLKCFSFVCYIANAVLVYYLFLKIFKIPETIVFLLALTFSLNSFTIHSSHVISAETPFLLSLLISFYFIMEYVNHDRNNNIFIFLLPISMICTWQIRSLGLAIILAVFIYLFIKKNFKKLSLLFLSSSLMLLLLLSFYKKFSGNSIALENDGYFSGLTYQLSQPEYLFQLIYNSFSSYFYIIPRSLFGFFYDTIGHFNLHNIIIFKIMIFLFSLIVLLIIALGYFNLFRSRNLSGLFIAIYFLALIFWPYNSGRFIFPILPFILIYFYSGLKIIMQKMTTIFNGKNFNFLLTGIFISILVSSAAENMYRAFIKNENIYVLHKNGLSSYPDEWKDYLNGLLWIERNIPDNSIILARDNSLCFLITGNKSVSVEWSKSTNDVMKLINENNIDYVIANPYYKKSNERFIFNLIEENSTKFFQVYGSDDNSVRIFKINRISRT